ncbi:MAG: VWA domain-containing protein [Vicinamibacterales bacterium]
MKAFLTAGLAVLAAAAAAAGQQPQVPGAFRSRITLVPIDVRVLDRKGHPVTDLTREEFRIFEDGRPQEIGTFEHVAFTPAALPPETADARPALRRAVGPDLAAPSGRVFLFVLGRGRLQHPTRILDALMDFVETRLLPQDHAAVIAYNRATDFTRDHRRLKTVIEAFRQKHERIEARMTARQSGLVASFGNKAVPPELQADVDAIFKSPGAPGFREMPPGRATDAARIEQDIRDVGNLLRPVGVSMPVAGLAPDTPDELASLDAYMEGNVKTLQDLGGLLAGIEYLRYLDGEKHLVYVSEFGLQLPRGDYDESIATIASDARVVVDVIHTGGVTSTFVRGLPRANWRHTWSLAGLRTLAERTGGRAALFKRGHEALADIDRASRSQYVVGYYPDRSEQDGRYRRITVNVTRPGLTVLYRNGYYARQQLVPIDRRQFMAHNRIIAAGSYPGPIGDIGVKVDAAFDRATRDVQIRLAIEPDTLRVVQQDGVHLIELDVAVYSGDQREGLVSQLWQRIDLRLTAEELASALAHDIRYTLTFRSERVPAHVKVVVYDHAADLTGTAAATVR